MHKKYQNVIRSVGCGSMSDVESKRKNVIQSVGRGRVQWWKVTRKYLIQIIPSTVRKGEPELQKKLVGSGSGRDVLYEVLMEQLRSSYTLERGGAALLKG